MPDTALIATGGTALGLSIVFFLAEAKSRREHEAWCAAAARADGVVSRIGLRGHLSRNPPSSFDDRGVSVPVVRFRAADGAEYEFDAPDAPHQIGSATAVAYDPALPSDARLLVRRPKTGCAVVVFLAGVALVVAGLTQ